MSSSPGAADGYVAPGFEMVADEFERNFSERGDVGAAFAATVDGEAVVDLWGGIADSSNQQPWDPDTTQMVFSGSKGLVALCLLILADRGLLDLEAPVARYWPEFAARGKSSISVAEVASHRSRLPAVRTPLTEEDLLDSRRLAALLADQPPEKDPRTRFAYHALTYGWLCDEIIRRVDGRSVGKFFREEVAGPLDLELWIGTGNGHEATVARLEYAPDWGTKLNISKAEADRDELKVAAWANPILFPADKPLYWNFPAWHEAEIPAVNAIGTARSIARLYGCLARGGELDGVRLLSEPTLLRGRAELSRGVDPLIGDPLAFGIGFQLQTPLMVYGPPADAFGHSGAGGSVHAAWPSQGVGVSYAMNQLRDSTPVDPRAQPLLASLHRALRR